MKITERLLLDNYTATTNGMELLSTVNGEKVFWVYRTGLDSDGYNCICNRGEAGEITLESNRTGVIPMDDACADHPALADIDRDEQIMIGNQVRPPKDQRTVTIRLRLTPAEREQVDNAAAEAGVTLSQYIRSKIL